SNHAKAKVRGQTPTLAFPSDSPGTQREQLNTKVGVRPRTLALLVPPVARGLELEKVVAPHLEGDRERAIAHLQLAREVVGELRPAGARERLELADEPGQRRDRLRL